jgi:predicted dehydrogenase
MSKVYTASVVGAGMGGRLSMSGLRNSSRFKLVAVADVRPAALEQARKDFPGTKTYATHKAMFKDCPTDMVCVSTYAPTHLPITLDALRMLPLKGILVEKPLGDRAAAGREIIRRVKARKLPMAVPHNLLTAPHSLEILKRVHGGEIGRLELMEVQCDKWDAFNAGIHWMNFFVNATRNEPIDFVLAAADATTRTYRDGMQVETEAVSYVVTKTSSFPAGSLPTRC